MRPGNLLFFALLAWLTPRAASADPGDRPPEASMVRLVQLQVPGASLGPSRTAGLARLGLEARRRTSICVAPEVGTWVLGEPLPTPEAGMWLVWTGDSAVPPLSPRAVQQLGDLLRAGASLWVDASDGVADGPFERSVLRELARALPRAPLRPVPSTHVLYKSFYLLDRHGGRTQARAQLHGITLGGRLAVLLSANDVLGALVQTPSGAWAYAVPDGEHAREMALRLGLNWLMACLCLDYKEDQVHLPFILRRRH